MNLNRSIVQCVAISTVVVWAGSLSAGQHVTGLEGVAASVQPGLQPRNVPAKGERPIRPGFEHRLVVKFRDDVRARATPEGVVSQAGVALQDVTELEVDRNVQFEQLIRLPQERINFIEQRAAQSSGIAQPDLAGMMQVIAADEQLQAVADALHASDLIEWVEFEEINPPPPTGTPCIDIAPVTPDYVPMQTYRGPDPGMNMDQFWSITQAKGAKVKIANCEYWYNGDHEDLCDIIPEPGQTPHPNALANGWDNHGTAVMGQLVGGENDYGVTGLVPDAEAYFFPEWTVEEGLRRVTAIANAIATVDPGDVVLLEMQTTGAGGGFGPAELNLSVWNVVKAGTDAHVIVVAAAGNGNQDLDSAPYIPYMDRGDSGAIIVGAGSANTAHNKLGFSTYGSRVNVQGWGQSVFTLGYGNYAEHGGDVNQRYTATFSGTSSASPFVAAAAVALQSFAKDYLGWRLTPREIREILIDTGIPQGTGGHIGPFPDMVAAADVVRRMCVAVDINGCVQPTGIPYADDGTLRTDAVLYLLSAWGKCDSEQCPADINGDGKVDATDLLLLLSGE